MRILIIADEVWNDRINGNNVLTNWFQGFPAEFAEIYATPGTPYNSICQRYFQITDGEMIRSIKTGILAGNSFVGDYSNDTGSQPYNSTDVGHLGFARKYMGNSLRLLKTIVWNHGRIDEAKLKAFIEDFSPDIIFSARYAHSKILRLERLALKYAHCPIVAFTGDNEYSLRRFSLNPIFWLNLIYQRNCLKKMMGQYSLYYTLSECQIEEYQRAFNTPMKVLRKCSPRPMEELELRELKEPIQIVYGGKLYAGRDETLSALANAIRLVNEDGVHLELHIYTGSIVNRSMAKSLNDGKSSYIHKPVSSDELEQIYRKSDIALSVESFRLSQRLSTRVSFSTKLIDCLYSTCAVMMIGWEENSGFEYLKKQDAAICIGSINQILPILKKLLDSPQEIQKYRVNAHRCMVENHNRFSIQDGIYQDFSRIINKEFN